MTDRKEKKKEEYKRKGSDKTALLPAAAALFISIVYALYYGYTGYYGQSIRLLSQSVTDMFHADILYGICMGLLVLSVFTARSAYQSEHRGPGAFLMRIAETVQYLMILAVIIRYGISYIDVSIDLSIADMILSYQRQVFLITEGIILLVSLLNRKHRAVVVKIGIYAVFTYMNASGVLLYLLYKLTGFILKSMNKQRKKNRKHTYRKNDTADVSEEYIQAKETENQLN